MCGLCGSLDAGVRGGKEGAQLADDGWVFRTSFFMQVGGMPRQRGGRFPTAAVRGTRPSTRGGHEAGRKTSQGPIKKCKIRGGGWSTGAAAVSFPSRWLNKGCSRGTQIQHRPVPRAVRTRLPRIGHRYPGMVAPSFRRPPRRQSGGALSSSLTTSNSVGSQWRRGKAPRAASPTYLGWAGSPRLGPVSVSRVQWGLAPPRPFDLQHPRHGER